MKGTGGFLEPESSQNLCPLCAPFDGRDVDGVTDVAGRDREEKLRMYSQIYMGINSPLGDAVGRADHLAEHDAEHGYRF